MLVTHPLCNKGIQRFSDVCNSKKAFAYIYMYSCTSSYDLVAKWVVHLFMGSLSNDKLQLVHQT